MNRRFAFVLRLALVAMLLAISGAPAAPDLAREARPCAMATDAHEDGKSMREQNGPQRADCDMTCPMHLALTPDFTPAFEPAAPAPAPETPPSVLKSRAPPSPERPPRTFSA